MNFIENMFYKGALRCSEDCDVIKDFTGGWVDLHHGIDFQWNSMFVDTTGKKKDRLYLKSIAEARFSDTIITGFIKSSNGYHDLKSYVLVLEGNGCSKQDMNEFCKTLPDVEAWFLDTCDEWEETHTPLKVMPSSFWASVTEPALV